MSQQPSTMSLSSTQYDAFDREQYDEMRLITGESFAGLLDQFHSSMRDGLLAIRAAIDISDAAELKRASHKLKGTTGTLGAKGLSELCAELEKMGREQRFDNANVTLEQLSYNYLKTRALIESVEQEYRLADAS